MPTEPWSQPKPASKLAQRVSAGATAIGGIGELGHGWPADTKRKMNDLVALFNLVSLTVSTTFLTTLPAPSTSGHGGGKAGHRGNGPQEVMWPRIGNQLQREAGNILGDREAAPCGSRLTSGLNGGMNLILPSSFRPLTCVTRRSKVAVG